MAICLVHKKYTETLAGLLDRFRNEHTEYQNVKITYAGRLDPLAEGLVILLTGDDVHKKNQFLGLDKEYVVECALGVSTDSYDLLGIPDAFFTGEFPGLSIIKTAIDNTIGTYDQPYPAFSSKTVNGKPLWVHTRNNQHTVSIPRRSVNVSEAELLEINEVQIQNCEYFKKRNDIINAVSGDFRQEVIIESWNSLIDHKKDISLIVLKMRFVVSSGTYIRGIVHNIGQQLGCGAVSFKITRTRIGDYTQIKY